MVTFANYFQRTRPMINSATTLITALAILIIFHCILETTSFNGRDGKSPVSYDERTNPQYIRLENKLSNNSRQSPVNASIKVQPTNWILPDASTKKESECMYTYTPEEAEEAPWTATIRLEDPKAIGTGNYFSGVILDEYTIVTCGKAFHARTDKLQFLAWGNYTINAGSVTKTSNGFNFSQTVQVSYIQPHPKYDAKWNDAYWRFSENFYIIIHLKEPLIFSREVRPACWPKLSELGDTSGTNALASENVTVLLGGWIRSAVDLTKTSLNVKLEGTKDCAEEWKRRGFTEDQTVIPYKNRACGYSTDLNQNNPHAQCIDKNSGAFVSENGRYEFIGFLNTYYAVLDMCDKDTFFFLYLTSEETFQWMNYTMNCGSFQYTCHNGECVSLETVCNQKNDGCSDGSDENPRYCRALNPCGKDEFECGVYGECIPKDSDGKEPKNCDGVPDCKNHEDEDPQLCSQEQLAPESSTNTPTVVLIAVAVVCVLTVSLGAVFVWRWRRVRRKGLAEEDAVRDLTEEEVMAFENGFTETSEEDAVSGPDLQSAYIRPWDISTYEIPFENIKIGVKIGSGNFGNIYKGQIRNGVEECAIKIPHRSTDVDQIKTLLKELKIMIFVGQHENIVRFIGAYTRKIRNRVLYIVLEYCAFGSMDNFLRTHKSYYTGGSNVTRTKDCGLGSCNIGADSHYVSMADVYEFSVFDLIRWAIGIASGMEFLARKNVIHGDLAARNILLDAKKCVKISDFGLSHHLYTSATYIVSVQRRLPWKWMGPETLRYGTLKTKSDVWSYGVTLWEMFSLGSVPYGGLEWSQGFVQNLSSIGSTLGQPEYANPRIYEIMQQCWMILPDDRPSFEVINKSLVDILEETSVGADHIQCSQF